MPSPAAPPGAIPRSPGSEEGRAHDLVVVGGGIHGVMVLLEASRRGLSALLLERGDFGGETSWNSLRIVHGGLRYLQHADLARFRRSVVERRWFLRTFPELVEPLACLLPLYGTGVRRPAVMRAALALDDLLSRDRNAGLRPDRRLPSGRVLGRRDARSVFPGFRPEGLRGAARWYDASMRSPARVIVESLRWAVAAGGAALNYVEAEEVLVEDGRVAGVRGRDHVSGRELRFRAPAVVDAAGPWAGRLARRAAGADGPGVGVEALRHSSLAFNVLFDRPPPSRLCVGVEEGGTAGGTLFLRPWGPRLLAGTAHAPRATIDGPGPTEAELEAFIAALNRGVPGLGLERGQALRVLYGYLPTREPGTVRPARKAAIVDHGRRGGPIGLLSLSGVKLTTARSVAERALRRLYGADLDAPGMARPPERVGARVPWAPEALLEEAAGDRATALERAAALCREEAVVRPDDLLRRRTEWWLDERVAAIGREAFDLARPL